MRGTEPKLLKLQDPEKEIGRERITEEKNKEKTQLHHSYTAQIPHTHYLR